MIFAKILSEILMRHIFVRLGKPELPLSQHTLKPQIYEVKINFESVFSFLLLNPYLEIGMPQAFQKCMKLTKHSNFRGKN